MFRIVAVVAVCIFTRAIVFADGGPIEYQIRGRVIDQNHAAVPGASVRAIRDDQKPVLTVYTNHDGEFRMSLEPGQYRLSITADGFAEYVQRLVVDSRDTGMLELEMQIAPSSATVMISDSSGYDAVVTSATRTYTPLLDTPQSISVVSRAQMADQLMGSVGDVVRYLPGVTAHQGENNRDQIIIRGQSSSADFFVDGIRDDVQYYRDLYNIERFETLRGPNAMIFGRGGGGGVVNRVTKSASFSPVRELRFQGGSFGNKRVSADIGQPLNDKAAVRFNTFFENSDSYRDNVSLQRFGFNPTLVFNPDEETSLSVSYEYFNDRRTADRGITSFQGRPADVPYSTFYGDADDSRVKANVNLISGTFDRHIGNFLIHNRTTFGDYDRFYQNYVPGAANADATLVTLTAYNNATRRRNLFTQTDVTYEFSTGSIKHTFLSGFELGRQRTNNFRNTGFFNDLTTSMQVPFENPQASVPVTFRQSATDADNHLSVNLAAAYGQYQLDLTRFVKLIGGLRLDYFDLNYLNRRNGDELRRIDRLASPRFGIVIKPVTSLSVYGSYSVSYLPSSGDQFSSLTSLTQQVKPEKFQNLEVGIKWDLGRNLYLTSAAYRLDRTNTRSTDPNDPTRIIQTGSQRTNGFEIALNGSITPKWTIAGGYAYQDAVITSATASAAAGKQVGQVPHHNFSLWNKYQILKKLGAGFGIIQRSDMFAAVDNTVTLPGYVRADAAAYYDFNEKWRLQANVENVFNTRYYLNADSNTNITPGSPTAVRVGLTARF